ncbi:hypothetical protein AB0A70_15620 [Streptomyces morookaense]|uniref:hypothetical protein n=1 Tax=Streptomyces morookaense TaxID=1970 RepID=UPI0033FB98D9
MASKNVGGPELSTSWADKARVEVKTYTAGNNPSLVIEYARGATPQGTVRLRFDQVMSYEWIGFDYYCLVSNQDDIEFSLIELANSEKLRTLAEKARLPGMLIQDGKVKYEGRVVLHHYRLGFDEHGTYDVICGEPVAITSFADGTELPPDLG